MCSIHGSIECRPWSQWQHLNRTKYPRLAAKISQEQAESAALVEQFIRVANICLDNGGDCSFEWPRYCTGWALPSIQSWILETLRETCIQPLSMAARLVLKLMANQSRSLGDFLPLYRAWPRISQYWRAPTVVMPHFKENGPECQPLTHESFAIWWFNHCFLMLSISMCALCRVLRGLNNLTAKSLSQGTHQFPLTLRCST